MLSTVIKITDFDSLEIQLMEMFEVNVLFNQKLNPISEAE